MEEDAREYRIALLVPTRKRPEGVKRLLKSIEDTVDNKDLVTSYFYVDEDDFDTIKLLKAIKKRNSYNIEYLIGPRIILSEMVNKLYPLTSEFILFFGADDIVFRTKGWDTILQAGVHGVPDGIGLFYGNDLVTTQHAPNFATHPIITREWVNVVGYVSPPYFSCDYADTWLNDIADRSGRKFPLPFINEHMHPTVGKANYDSTYAENRQKFLDDNVPSLYQQHGPEIEEAVVKIKEATK